MSNHILEGNKHFIKGNYDSAIISFSEVIDKDEKLNVKGLINRGTCYLELKKYDLALEDFENAKIKNTINKSFELYYKLGLCQFKLKKFLEADISLKTALLDSSSSDERDILTVLQNKVKIELDLMNNEKLKKVGDIKFSYNWYQNDENVYVTLDCNKHLNDTNYKVIVDKRNLYVMFDNVLVYTIEMSNNCDENATKYKIFSQKIEITIKKEIKFNWIVLEKAKISEVQRYPTSMKKDYNVIQKEVDDQLKKDKTDPSGNDAMMYLFKEIYANSSEETKRAMMKSYSTSGGTVLSTNWGEVKEKDYEGKDRPSAPEGQQWSDNKS